MRYRTIAGTDISGPEVGFGVWTVAAGWWGDYSDKQARELTAHVGLQAAGGAS